MGSTICVRCGANLIPRSYCDVCHDVLCFTCSSCSMNTDERIHTNCRDVGGVYKNSIYLHDTQKLMENPKSYQLIIMENIKLNIAYDLLLNKTKLASKI